MRLLSALTNWNCPNSLLSIAISRSPWWTLISTWVCPSAAVENTWLFFVGMVVFLLISFVKTPPNVSIPKDNGVTSSNNTSVTSPAKTPPWKNTPIITRKSLTWQLVLPKTFDSDQWPFDSPLWTLTGLKWRTMNWSTNLDGSSHSHCLVWVDGFAGCSSEQVLHCWLHLQHQNNQSDCQFLKANNTPIRVISALGHGTMTIPWAFWSCLRLEGLLQCRFSSLQRLARLFDRVPLFSWLNLLPTVQTSPASVWGSCVSARTDPWSSTVNWCRSERINRGARSIIPSKLFNLIQLLAATALFFLHGGSTYLKGRWQFTFGFLRGFLQPLNRHVVFCQVNSLLQNETSFFVHSLLFAFLFGKQLLRSTQLQNLFDCS